MRWVFLAAALAFATPAPAADLYEGGGWPALSADRTAAQTGDILTVLVFENSEASNTAQSSTRRNTRLTGSITAGDTVEEGGDVSLEGSFDGAGRVGRAGKLVAQISVVVDAVLPNGDLHVAGEQILNIDGDRTRIRLKGRVRRADISSANTVISSRLADVMIDYDGRGFVARGARPGLVSRVFSFLGLV